MLLGRAFPSHFSRGEPRFTGSERLFQPSLTLSPAVGAEEFPVRHFGQGWIRAVQVISLFTLFISPRRSLSCYKKGLTLSHMTIG